jgi:hypothetical protein
LVDEETVQSLEGFAGGVCLLKNDRGNTTAVASRAVGNLDPLNWAN